MPKRKAVDNDSDESRSDFRRKFAKIESSSEDESADTESGNDIIDELISDLISLGDPVRAKLSRSYFKTAESFEGDKFIGITAPKMRETMKKYTKRGSPKRIDFETLTSKENIPKLVGSDIREIRLCCWLFLLDIFKKEKDIDRKKRIVDFYLDCTRFVNHWDLVDQTAPYLLGNFVYNSEQFRNEYEEKIYSLAESKIWWERRIAMLSMLYYIKNMDFEVPLRIVEVLLEDEHDLIHKAVGWMLREIGKKRLKLLEDFLEENKTRMPRVALRYSIEKLDPEKRKYYLTSSK